MHQPKTTESANALKERKMRNKNEALQQFRRGFPWKLSAIFLKNIGKGTKGFDKIVRKLAKLQ
jgi:hypothetical protein